MIGINGFSTFIKAIMSTKSYVPINGLLSHTVYLRAFLLGNTQNIALGVKDITVIWQTT